jgi:hypothetical protein
MLTQTTHTLAHTRTHILSSKRCDRAGCTRRAQYLDAREANPRGGVCAGKGKRRVGKYCREHRPAVYLFIYHKTCMYAEGCSKIASFGSKSEGVPKYCAAHKNAGHVLVYVSPPSVPIFPLFFVISGSCTHVGATKNHHRMWDLMPYSSSHAVFLLVLSISLSRAFLER